MQLTTTSSSEKEIFCTSVVPSKVAAEKHDRNKVNDHYNPVCRSSDIMESFLTHLKNTSLQLLKKSEAEQNRRNQKT